MATKIVDIKCPNCGASVDTGQKTCKFCKQPVIISTFNSVYEMPMPTLNQYANAYRQALSESPEDKNLNNSIAMCYLKLKLYDKAFASFEKAMVDNFDNSETFFYAAICLLGGKKAFLAQRPAIDKIEEYGNKENIYYGNSVCKKRKKVIALSQKQVRDKIKTTCIIFGYIYFPYSVCVKEVD
jgi:tetratricopeptide (TPR) repeat protein